jgi:hypothetical protein
MSLNVTVFKFLKLDSTLAELDVGLPYLKTGIINPDHRGSKCTHFTINGINDGKYIPSKLVK